MRGVLQSNQEQMETVWRQRAERLSRRVVLAEAGQNLFPVIALGIGNERYGIDLSDVAEILPRVRPTPVPGAAAVFSGVINVHGEIRPVLDLRRFLGIQTLPDRHSSRVILLHKDGREMGLQIDSVEQIRWIGPGDLDPAGKGGPAMAPHFKGATKDLLMLLNTEALFSEIQEGVTT
jgi:purine-binding chemotaxis protein CheW